MQLEISAARQHPHNVPEAPWNACHCREPNEDGLIRLPEACATLLLGHRLVLEALHMRPQMLPHITDILYSKQNRKNIQQLLVIHVIDKCSNGDRIVGLEDIGVWGVVHDDSGCQLAPQAGQILDVVPLVWVAGLPEQAPSNRRRLVQQIQQGVRVFGQGWP